MTEWESDSPRVSLLEPASVPKSGDSARKMRVVAGGGAGAFALGFLVAATATAVIRRAWRR